MSQQKRFPYLLSSLLVDVFCSTVVIKLNCMNDKINAVRLSGHRDDVFTCFLIMRAILINALTNTQVTMRDNVMFSGV